MAWVPESSSLLGFLRVWVEGLGFRGCKGFLGGVKRLSKTLRGVKGCQGILRGLQV